MTIIPVLKCLVLDILSRSTEQAVHAAFFRGKRTTLIGSLASGLMMGAVSVSAAAAGQDPRDDPQRISPAKQTIQLAQATPSQRNAQIRRAQAHCRKVTKQFFAVAQTPCAKGDRLDRARSVCLPPKGIFKPYSRWDPAAGRCKPRHRFDGGTCAGGKVRYKAGKHHAHALSDSIRMYSSAPSRLAAAHKQCRRALADFRSRVGAERVLKQRRCAQARQQNDRKAANFYCR